MLYKEISRVFAYYLFGLAMLLCLPLMIAGYYEYFTDPAMHPQPHSTMAFVDAIFIAVFLGACLRFAGKGATGELFRREGLAVVVLIWFMTAVIGGIPFYSSGVLENPLDAYFEAMSGLTTTGASVMHPKAYDPATGQEIQNIIQGDYEFYGTIKPVRDLKTGKVLYTGIEAVGKALLFWRSLMQWLGGMGIVVLFIAILPALGVGGRVLYQAEVPGPTKEGVTPRIKETASVLWKLYLAFTVIEVALLMFTNDAMPLFDAVCISFSNVSTGGFSIKNASIGGYNNSSTEWIVLIFMVVGSINFALYFHCLKGRIYRLYEPEFIIYLTTLLLGCCFMAWHLYGTEKILLNGETGIFDLPDAVRYGAFHHISAQTSTGYVTADFNLWPMQNQILMLLVMFVGSMSGSTGGGIKIVRHYMLFRIAKNQVESIFRPETVRTFRIGNNEVDNKAAIMVLTFFFIVLSLAVAGTFFMVLDGVDLETALSINACMINNIGLAFRAAGPSESFAFLSPFSKILSTFLMVLGRLEFFAVLIVFVPAFWKGK
jgi:trk system potassium uptake protein TrkH